LSCDLDEDNFFVYFAESIYFEINSIGSKKICVNIDILATSFRFYRAFGPVFSAVSAVFDRTVFDLADGTEHHVVSTVVIVTQLRYRENLLGPESRFDHSDTTGRA
jgi:hypothetical protein